MDVSFIATAYTAFSEVLVGFAWGTESYSGNGIRRRWWRRASRNQAGATADHWRPGGLHPTPPGHPALSACRSAGHDNGQTPLIAAGAPDRALWSHVPIQFELPGARWGA